MTDKHAIDCITADAMKLSTSGFIMSLAGCPSLNATSKGHTFSELATDNTVVRADAGIFSFFPVYDVHTHNMFFEPTPDGTFALGLVAVSHKLKQIDFFCALAMDDSTVIYLVKTSYNSKLFDTHKIGIDPSDCLFNVMHRKYKHMLDGIVTIGGVFLSIEQYMSYKAFEHDCMVHRQIDARKETIRTLEENIEIMRGEIAAAEALIEKLSDQSAFLGKLDVARVEYDLACV